jgi:hypothetical protein
VSNDAISAYIVNGLINGDYQWRLRERPLFDYKLGAFVQRSISANGAQPATSHHFERPLSGSDRLSRQYANYLKLFTDDCEGGQQCDRDDGDRSESFAQHGLRPTALGRQAPFANTLSTETAATRAPIGIASSSTKKSEL